MPESALLILASGFVGFLIGAVGVGGILLIPSLVALAGLSPHQASATALFTFLFTGILGTLLFQRNGSIDWRQSGAVCAGALVFSYAGVLASTAIDDKTLMRIIAMLIIFAGAYVFIPGQNTEAGGKPKPRYLLLLGIGAISGFGSGFSGAGGPLFSVPLMLVSGFPALLAVGTSQVLQIISAASGTFANLRYGDIQWQLVLTITLAELCGVLAGVKLAHSVGQHMLKKGAGAICLLVGIWLLTRNL
ncbi:MAG: sulfite exporter TauE/SafE family protein [Usitatibacteraceae bacterium]